MSAVLGSGVVTSAKHAVLITSCGLDDTATVRVTNLSEDATEQDLRELFGHFGAIQRIYLARDRTSQRSKVSRFVA